MLKASLKYFVYFLFFGCFSLKCISQNIESNKIIQLLAGKSQNGTGDNNGFIVELGYSKKIKNTRCM